MLPSPSNRLSLWRGALLLFCLSLLLLFIVPGPAFAEPLAQDDSGAEPCARCHWSETSTWQPSHHAANGVTCSDCHGAYVEDHPSEGVMQLTVDASQCRNCHPVTNEEWQDSLHAELGVNCINCHVPHSQTTRLASEQLCCSCHSGNTDSSENHCAPTAHKASGLTCVDCHLSKPQPGDTPGHTFTIVPAQLCVDCHAPKLHQAAPEGYDPIAKAQLASLSEKAQILTAELDASETEKTSFQTLSLLTLGVGLGIGTIFGLVVMMALSYINQKREAEK